MIFVVPEITRIPNGKIDHEATAVLVAQIGKVHRGRLMHIKWVRTDDLEISKLETR